MLLEIENQYISTQLFEKKFICDLNACKGACCIEGNSGAPLSIDEIDIIEEELEHVTPYMRPEGIAAIEESGVFYMDEDNEPVTTLVNEAECAFVYFDEKGITKCAIEKAYLEGKIEFKKPISCHLYPIRIMKMNEKEVLTYNEWDICAPACACGEKMDVPVYRFLKEPITRKYGEIFYLELDGLNEFWEENYK